MLSSKKRLWLAVISTLLVSSLMLPLHAAADPDVMENIVSGGYYTEFQLGVDDLRDYAGLTEKHPTEPYLIVNILNMSQGLFILATSVNTPSDGLFTFVFTGHTPEVGSPFLLYKANIEKVKLEQTVGAANIKFGELEQNIKGTCTLTLEDHRKYVKSAQCETVIEKKPFKFNFEGNTAVTTTH